jgi:hypothetical protein
MDRVKVESVRLVCPDFADELVRGEALQELEASYGRNWVMAL